MDLIQKRELKLDLDPFKAYSFCLIGATRSGKSTLLNHLIQKYMRQKINILMTESPNGDIYKEAGFRQDCILCPAYIPELVKDCYLINKGTNNRYDFNFIMDDLVGFRSDKQMKKLLTIYRNSNMGVCITGQTISILDTTARFNVNYVFLGRTNADKEIENICKQFLASFFPSTMRMVDRIKTYKMMTSDYHFICLDNINGDVFLTKIKT
jgi:GTPase SAR1 family protein